MSQLQHLEVLSQQELEAVHKFNEYGGTITVGFGNKATWTDLVHTNSYSDNMIAGKLIDLRAKRTKEEEAQDEDELQAVPEFILRDRSGTAVPFSVEDCLLFVRAAKKVRKYFEDNKEIIKLQQQLKTVQNKKKTREERLAEEEQELTAQLNKLKGIKAEAPATTVTQAEAQTETK